MRTIKLLEEFQVDVKFQKLLIKLSLEQAELCKNHESSKNLFLTQALKLQDELDLFKKQSKSNVKAKVKKS